MNEEEGWTADWSDPLDFWRTSKSAQSPIELKNLMFFFSNQT